MTDEKTPPTPPPGGAGDTGASGSDEMWTAPPPSSDAPPPPPPGGASGAGAGGPDTPPPPPPGGSAPPPPGGASDNRQLMLILSYLWILALIPYLTEQSDPEVKWHSRHGLVLTAAEIVVNLVFFVLTMIPGIGCVISIVWMLVPIAVLALHVICIMKALKGERFLIPGVSQYADQIP